MGRPRQSDVELCFDSMTDLITNLAGGLILVVLLLMGLTREAPKTAPPRPASQAGPAADQRPVRPLRDRINRLHGAVAAADRDVALCDQQVRQLRQEVDDLLKKTAGASPPAGGPDGK